MRTLGTIYRIDADIARHRPQQPPQARRPLASQGPEHGEGVDGPIPVRPTTAAGNSAAGTCGLEASGHGDDALASQPGLESKDTDGVEALGVESGDGGTTVAWQVPSGAVNGDAKPAIRRRRRRSGESATVNPQAVLALLEQQAFPLCLDGMAAGAGDGGARSRDPRQPRR